jgi:hypothetical protein
MMMGYCGLMAPLARVTALMKTRAQNWPLETDAEIPVFVLVFAIRETGPRATNDGLYHKRRSDTLQMT